MSDSFSRSSPLSFFRSFQPFFLYKLQVLGSSGKMSTRSTCRVYEKSLFLMFSFNTERFFWSLGGRGVKNAFSSVKNDEEKII